VTIGFLLQPDRAARMVAQHAIDPSLPGLSDVIGVLRHATLEAAGTSPYEEEVRRAASRALVERLIWLAGGAPMPEVRAEASAALKQIADSPVSSGTPDTAARQLTAADIKRFLERPMEPIKTPSTYEAPPGAPIGDYPNDWLAPPSWVIR
jgi:hypothetical protein